MQSKTSYFNAMLFRKNLTRFWPLWTMASLLAALPPLILATELVRGYGSRTPLSLTDMYYSAISTAAPILSEGDVLGCVVFLCEQDHLAVGETEYPLAQTIAGFLGRHMEA